ncbi:MAG: hypothetical protein EHM12_02190 [Dehalococcoidia bacterium]|nr:MAG: hypothetical protein EHM12_02190 [Dehalococcoidia bacterium]
MLRIELVPDLSHCIHTVAKKEYNDVLRRLLSVNSGRKKLEEKLELLIIILKDMDFQQLRQESEKYLVEGKNVKFIFHLENGSLEYEMSVTNSNSTQAIRHKS